MIVQRDFHRPGMASLAGRCPRPDFVEPAAALREGQPLVVDDVERSPLLSERTRFVYHAIEFGAYICVPMVKGEQLIWTLTVVSNTARHWTPDDVTLVQEVGERTWDAVERARSAEELRQSQRKLVEANGKLTRAVRVAEEAVEARDEFLSVAAHELKTPVTSLRGYAQTLLRRYQAGEVIDRGRLVRALQIIDQQSHKLGRLVSHLLDLSRLENGQLVLERQRADLVPLVHVVVSMARLSATRHALVVETPARAEASVDPIRIEQVLTNLVDNAIRYSPTGGRVEITLSLRGSKVVFEVRDHGIGIPLEHLPRIFDRFYRAHEGGSIAGLGIGLYVSREIVTLHGGRIEVESPPDGGSRFIVTLPLGDERADGRVRLEET
jgi:signal transduction histidine kinase